MDVTVDTDAGLRPSLDAFAGDVPMVAVERGGFLNSLHRGSAAVTDPTGRVTLSVGDVEQPVFMRSGAKPFQVIPAVLSGGIERFGITSRELAVLCASHSGEPRHTEAVLSVLFKIGLSENALHCGIHPPLNERTAQDRWRSGIEPTPVCNNCSGAHAGMLVACKANGWPIEDYGLATHPLQLQTRRIVASFTGMDQVDVQIAIDNCAVPTFRVPLSRAALAFARLATQEEIADDFAVAAGQIVRAMTAHADMVGGEHRFDSDLMHAGEGGIVSKGGAEGFQGIGLAGQRLGVAIKISDGNPRAIPPVAMRLLDHLSVFSPGARGSLQDSAEPVLHDLLDEPVGRLTVAFNPAAGT